MLGAVVYDGPSRLDGERVVCVVTGFHVVNNPKTGDMLQTWILRADQHPMEARKSGADFSVCVYVAVADADGFARQSHNPLDHDAVGLGGIAKGDDLPGAGPPEEEHRLVHEDAVARHIGRAGDIVADVPTIGANSPGDYFMGFDPAVELKAAVFANDLSMRSQERRGHRSAGHDKRSKQPLDAPGLEDNDGHQQPHDFLGNVYHKSERLLASC